MPPRSCRLFPPAWLLAFKRWSTAALAALRTWWRRYSRRCTKRSRATRERERDLNINSIQNHYLKDQKTAVHQTRHTKTTPQTQDKPKQEKQREEEGSGLQVQQLQKKVASQQEENDDLESQLVNLTRKLRLTVHQQKSEQQMAKERERDMQETVAGLENTLCSERERRKKHF
jgi:hypothetical protein